MLLISHNQRKENMTYIVIEKTEYKNISPSVRIVDDEAYDLETAQAVKKVCELKNDRDNKTFHLMKVSFNDLRVVKKDENFNYSQLELPFNEAI